MTVSVCILDCDMKSIDLTYPCSKWLRKGMEEECKVEVQPPVPNEDYSCVSSPPD